MWLKKKPPPVEVIPTVDLSSFFLLTSSLVSLYFWQFFAFSGHMWRGRVKRPTQLIAVNRSVTPEQVGSRWKKKKRENKVSFVTFAKETKKKNEKISLDRFFCSFLLSLLIDFLREEWSLLPSEQKKIRQNFSSFPLYTKKSDMSASRKEENHFFEFLLFCHHLSRIMISALNIQIWSERSPNLKVLMKLRCY